MISVFSFQISVFTETYQQLAIAKMHDSNTIFYKQPRLGHSTQI